MSDLEKIYLNMSQEDKKLPENIRINIDNFCDENTTDIAEDVEVNIKTGWNECVKNALLRLLTKVNLLICEIRNGSKGSYTKCKTTEELAEYLRNISKSFEMSADEISHF